MNDKVILVVDDEIDLLEMIQSIFERAGFFNILTASSGREALKIWKERQPDMIILDIMMPGIDGLSVLKEVRETSNIPVLLLTARGEAEDRVAGLEVGADDYLVKPFHPKELLLRVQVILNRTYPQKERKIYLEAAVVQLTGKVADLTVLVLAEGADGGHCTRHDADGILQRRCRLTMVIGNFPAGLQIIRAAQLEVQLHILALQRLVEQFAVPAADVLRRGVGDVFLIRLPFHIVATGIHIRNELLLRAALLHSLFDMIRQPPLPHWDAERVSFGLRDGQTVLPTELAAIVLDLLHLPRGLMEFHARLECSCTVEKHKAKQRQPAPPLFRSQGNAIEKFIAVCYT